MDWAYTALLRDYNSRAFDILHYQKLFYESEMNAEWSFIQLRFSFVRILT